MGLIRNLLINLCHSEDDRSDVIEIVIDAIENFRI